MKRSLFAIIAMMILCLNASAQTKSVLRRIYAREACSILKGEDDPSIVGLAKKGEPLIILRPHYCFISETTDVLAYKVRTGDGTVGYIYSKYLTKDHGEAVANYLADSLDAVHRSVRNSFGGGEAAGCDFFPREKRIPGKHMPKVCYSLYITCSQPLLEKIDEYIAFAKTTKINTFVIDIKEDGAPGYKADAMAKYSPAAFDRARDLADLYKSIVDKLHAAGMWAIGRIVVFKDCHITRSHPECALWDRNSNSMLFHNKSNWPSAYSRYVWEYNTALAVESVKRFGFDEINFDYVRFPDRMTRIESHIEMRNRYNETKVQAIQRFVKYACDEIHKADAFVSIDVFGESANPGYTTAYGQYWPAISNVADVISGMPYPDHFSNGYYGINKPWNHPYELMRAWGQRVQDRQAVTPTPAVVRTWIQTWRVMRHVDRYGIDYDAAAVEKQIRGLFDAGLTGGYLTWLASCNLERYKSQAPAYSIEYFSDNPLDNR